MTEIAIDYGRKRTGFAICLSGVVLPQDPLVDTTWTMIAQRIRNLQSMYDCGTVVLGLPLTSSGKPTELSKEVELLAEYLRSEGFEMELMRETGSTKEAITQKTDDRRDGKRDSLAAAIILKRYLGQP
ncbi:MAG: pre-16S rRNA-processing nuclease YqgF [Candidatus Aegiribacteria sp.]|nr:pre-16S rRNA-processing nuclease YqgF [Candidatus Aegiribacteria sp.]